MNAFCKTMIVNHTVHVKVFHADQAKPVYDLPTLLMSEVVTPELDTLMYPRDNLAVFSPFRRALRKLTMLALHLCQGFLFLPEKAGMSNLLSIGESSQVSDTQVNSHVFDAFRQLRSSRHFAREGHKPLINLSLDGDGLDFAFERTMQFDFGFPYLGKMQLISIQLPARPIRIAETIVPVASLEPGIARRFSIAYAEIASLG